MGSSQNKKSISKSMTEKENSKNKNRKQNSIRTTHKEAIFPITGANEEKSQAGFAKQYRSRDLPSNWIKSHYSKYRKWLQRMLMILNYDYPKIIVVVFSTCSWNHGFIHFCRVPLTN